MVFTSQADQQWLKRKVGMFEDLVRDTWFYQHILEQGLEQGMERGIERGREQEREQTLRKTRLLLLDVVRVRFPDVIELAQQRANAMHDAEVLRRLIIKIAMAPTAEEARRFLLESPGNNGV
jgi:predicted transposase YdaD